MAMMLVRAVSELLPAPVVLKSLKLPLMAERLVLRFPIWVLRVLRPVKKLVPLEVTFPFRRSSVKMAKEQPRLLMAGPKVLTFVNPE